MKDDNGVVIQNSYQEFLQEVNTLFQVVQKDLKDLNMAWCVQIMGVHWIRGADKDTSYQLMVTRVAEGGALRNFLENLDNKISYKQAILWCHDLASAVYRMVYEC